MTTQQIDTRTQAIVLPDEDATDRLGALLSAVLRAGDTVLLQGPIGAGKTHLARALIRARMGDATEVPSPSFTLVQTYGNGTDAIWHADLYRLTHPDEIMELGLEDALGHALCLVEWPERMGGRMPRDALTIRLATAGDGRSVELAGGRDGLLHTIAQHWQERPDAR